MQTGTFEFVMTFYENKVDNDKFNNLPNIIILKRARTSLVPS
jgi:hypothetical protein